MAVLRTARIAGGHYLPPAVGLVEGPPGADLRAAVGGDVYTVPAGKRAIIRGIDLTVNAADMGATANAQVYVRSGLQYFYITYVWFGSLGNHHNWDSHCVLNPGDVLSVYANGITSAFFYQISGALVDIPPA